MVTVGFLASDPERSLILNWIEHCGVPATVGRADNRVTLHFHEEGPVSYWPEHVEVPADASSRDQKAALIAQWYQRESPGKRIVKWDESPIAVIREPRTLRGVLRTVGEVSFTATNLPKRFPRLAKMHRELRKWLKGQEHVFGPSFRDPPHAYYLEAGVVNYDWNIYAFPEAAESLRNGQYFVPDHVSEGSLLSLPEVSPS